MLIWCKYLYNNDNHNHNRVININFLHVISRHQKNVNEKQYNDQQREKGQ